MEKLVLYRANDAWEKWEEELVKLNPALADSMKSDEYTESECVCVMKGDDGNILGSCAIRRRCAYEQLDYTPYIDCLEVKKDNDVEFFSFVRETVDALGYGQVYILTETPDRFIKSGFILADTFTPNKKENATFSVMMRSTAPDMKADKHAATKSMIMCAIFLIIIVGGWSLLANLLFPDTETEVDYAEYIGSYKNLFVQLAENAQDAGEWTGITEADEVKEILEDGNISSIVAHEDRVEFEIDCQTQGLTRKLVYTPSGEYTFPAEYADWEEIETENADRCLVNPDNNQNSIDVTNLGDGFALEETYVVAQ